MTCMSEEIQQILEACFMVNEQWLIPQGMDDCENNIFR